MISSPAELAKSLASPSILLLVDDDEDAHQLYPRLTQQFNCEWEMASNGDEAMVKIREKSFDLVLLDLKFPGEDGVHIFSRIRAQRPRQPVVVLSGFIDADAMRAIHAIGFAIFIEKPSCLSGPFFEDMFCTLGIRRKAQ